jgi:hypothetical protein
MHFHKKKKIYILHAYNISIHFTVETSIDNIQRLYRLDLGQEFSLTCRASGYPVPTVSWVKEGSDFQSEVSFRICRTNYLHSTADYSRWKLGSVIDELLIV